MIATRDDGGSLIPILPDGTVGAPIATGIGQPGGLTLGQDGNWYVGIRIPWVLKKVQPDGTVSTFKTLDGKAVFWYTWGPEDDLYGSTRCLGGGEIYRIPLDGTAENAIPANLPSCVGGVAYRPQDNSLYVANNLSDYGLTKVSLDDYSSTELASSVYDVQAVAVGQSGIVYFTDDDGKVWSIDPDVTSTATQLALAPGFDEQFGLALAEGALMISSRGFGEVYRYPVNDGPIQHPSLGDMVAYLDLEQIDAAPGEAFEVPLVLASTEESDLPVAAFQSELNWQPSELNYITNREGDFNGAFVANDTEASQGVFGAAAARATNVAVPITRTSRSSSTSLSTRPERTYCQASMWIPRPASAWGKGWVTSRVTVPSVPRTPCRFCAGW
jgi:hypothetical protein